MVPNGGLVINTTNVRILNTKTKGFLLSIRLCLENMFLLCVFEPPFKLYDIAFCSPQFLSSLMVWEIYHYSYWSIL
jgi:hypothetical protein